MQFGVYKKTKDGKEKIENHTLNRLFSVINPNTSFNDFLDYFLIWYESSNNGVLIEVIKGLKKFCPDLYLHNPSNFTIYFKGSALERIEILNPARSISGEDLKNFIWIRNPNYFNIKDSIPFSNTGTGYSKQNAFALWGAYVKKAWIWNWNLAKNLGRPGGIFTAEGFLEKEDKEEIRSKYTASFGGAKNAGQPLVIGSGMKYQDITKSPLDADWNLGEQKAFERTAVAAGVPMELVGGGESTYQNRKHAKKELYKDEIIPFLNKLVQWLNYLLKEYLQNGEEIDYDLTGIDELKEDISEVIKNLEALKNRVTINEYRKFLSKMTDIELEDLGEKGDVILVSAGDVTLNEVLESPDVSEEKEDDI
ncbi:phage portal protein [Fusobacterium sp. SB021]|uniref:phage portal protein n=1 Tax=Fusobacterium sp. SB021 TaxID=2744227 RepID=UPI003CE95D64